MAAVLLNWITTGDHLVKTIGEGYWPVAGLDLALLASAALAAVAARKLRQRERAVQGASAGEPVPATAVADPTEATRA